MNTTAIRQHITADATNTIHFTLPPEMGRDVEIIIFPDKSSTSAMPADSLEMAHIMDNTGFAKNILNSPAEDIWNDL